MAATGRPRLHFRCSVEGCTHRPLARGWCSTHYSAWRRHPVTVATVVTRRPSDPWRAEHDAEYLLDRDYYRRRIACARSPLADAGEMLAPGAALPDVRKLIHAATYVRFQRI